MAPFKFGGRGGVLYHCQSSLKKPACTILPGHFVPAGVDVSTIA